MTVGISLITIIIRVDTEIVNFGHFWLDTIKGGYPMATYTCAKCGMSVNATCAKCDAPLVHDTLKLDDGTEVHVSKCPNGHGKIKSPLCCGQDMSCPIG